MKRYVWQPIAFFAVGVGFYIYNGIVWNTWMTYLPHILGYALICAGLAWARYKQDKMQNSKS